ncbi:CoA transferase [Streptomyces sp. PTM05]|uniref:CoA transferase n=1 Tax=Streptantibioticus parmotrematis TaxID=2873249 RepID=A0ABS7QTR8_9ACTN|nr:CoA transferase [Streptantibioticus parmotrematis]MBY8886126.1 CoA transferase [Streptantibioticus parmotrematis]
MAVLDPLTTDRPLDAATLRIAGPGPLTGPAARHLAALGTTCTSSDVRRGTGLLALEVPGLGAVEADVRWADVLPREDAADEATTQAACGTMAVHGRRDGAPRGLAVDYSAVCASALAVQGMLAALLGLARGGARTEYVTCAADRAALLTASQYLAAAGAPEAEAVPQGPGGPPFVSADGVRFELESLEPGPWAGFWRELGAPREAIGAGWQPFQFRYATACAPLPGALHTTTRSATWDRIREAARRSGAQVCALAGPCDAGTSAPWTFRAHERPAPTCATPPVTGAGLPLSGLTVLEAGRRVQAPMAAHLLRLLGADVVRIEPPGGDPLRGMPPCCGEVSARWLALNRGKRAIQADVKSAAGQAEVRELAFGADVFLHNWAPGKAEGFGLDAASLVRVNPQLVYLHTSGWAGRLAEAPVGTDFMVQARTGLGALVRPRDEPPAPSLMTLVDVLGGLLGTQAALAALLLRERTGRGVVAESSLLGAAETLVAAGGVRRPAGFRRPLPTADGWVALSDASAAAVQHALPVREMATDQAVRLLRERGLTATEVTADLARLPRDPRLRGVLTHDAHGAVTVPSPWRFR